MTNAHGTRAQIDRSIRALAMWVSASLFIALVALSPALPWDAQAQTEDPFAGIEQMVVVGENDARFTLYSDSSAIEFDAEHLEAIGAQDISDIATFTPNLEIRTPFAASNPTLFIRGVGLRDFTAASSSSVAVYNDEIYMNSPTGQLAQLFDTQNIEVLRGPQATLYGRNAAAGTLRVVARKPTGTPGATASVTYGRFQQVDLDLAVENVVVEDRLSIRTAAKWSTRGGTTHNRCGDIDYVDRPRRRDLDGRTPEGRLAFLIYDVNLACYSPGNTTPLTSPPGAGWTVGEAGYVKEWVNDTRNWAARSIARVSHPFLDMDWQLNVHGGQNRGDARQFQLVGVEQEANEQTPRLNTGSTDINGYIDADNRIFTARSRFGQVTNPFQGNPYEGDYDNVEKEKIDLFGANVVGKMSFGDYKLTTITGYEWSKRDTSLNLDGSPNPALHVEFANKSYQLTQELRLDFSDEGALSWQVAGMFLYDAITSRNFFPIGSVLVPAIDQQYTFLTRYGSAWGQMTWSPAETLSLEAGVRINYEEKELNLRRQNVAVIGGTGERRPVVFPIGSPRSGEVVPARRAFSAAREWGWAGSLVATWRPTADVDVYLKYVRGWKGPHINSSVVNPGPDGSDQGALPPPATPEILDSIEIGLKAKLWNGRFVWSSALFHYDYQDLQTYALRNDRGTLPVPELINAEDADILGVEMELDLRPLDGLAPPILEGLWIRLTFSWLDATYTDFVNTFTVQNDGDGDVTQRRGSTQNYTGNRLINSPEFAFIGFVALPIRTDWGVITPRFDWSFKDKVFFSVANSDLVAQAPLWLANLRVTYKSPDNRLELAGWIENLTDQAYTEDVLNLARLRRALLYAIGDPRTYGLTLTVRY